jgi:hypothetical protein
MSLPCPPVSTNSNGFPRASVMARTLVLKPPTRTSQGLALGVTLRGTRCARVGAVNRGIDKNSLKIRQMHTPGMYGIPDAISAPASKTLDDGVPPTHRFQQHAPRHAATKNPQHGNQKRTALLLAANTNTFVCCQNGVNHSPFLVTNFQSISHLQNGRTFANSTG